MDNQSQENNSINNNFPTASEQPSPLPTRNPETAQPQPQPQPQIQQPQPISNPPINPTSISTPENTSPTASPNPKKRRNIKIIIIIASVFVAAGIAFAIWFFAFFNNTQKIAADALSNLLTAERISVDGDFEIQTTLGEQGLSAKTYFESHYNKNLPLSMNIKNDINIGDEEALSVSTKSILQKDGTLYMSIDGTQEVLENISSNFPIVSGLEPLIELSKNIDQKWWELKLPDILDSMGADETTKNQFNGLYNCVLNNIQLSDESLSEINELYKQNIFLDLEKAEDAPLPDKSGQANFILKIDAEKLTDFLNGIRKSGIIDRFSTCVVDTKIVENKDDLINKLFPEVDKNNVRSSIDNMPTIYLGIHKWSHELLSGAMEYSDESQSTTYNINFNYSDNFNIQPPSDYQPISELVKNITEAIQGISVNLTTSSSENSEENQTDGIFGERSDGEYYEDEYYEEEYYDDEEYYEDEYYDDEYYDDEDYEDEYYSEEDY